MKRLERIRVVQFFLYEQEDVSVEEITGIFGPNGSGKSSLLDAVQIAMLGANSRYVALNAQSDEKSTTRSLKAYCLGQYGEGENRARNNAITYITLIWRDTITGIPISMGVCLHASTDRDSHEVLGRYLLHGIELSMGDHLEMKDGNIHPRAWTTFRHQLIQRSKEIGQEPLYNDSDRYIRAVLLALRGSGDIAPSSEAFIRAFRFALRMRFDKSVDQIVRNDVLEDRPTNIKKFKEITETFRLLKERVAQVEEKIADGQRVSDEFDKAIKESSRTATWTALMRTAETESANRDWEDAQKTLQAVEDTQKEFEERVERLEQDRADADIKATQARAHLEAHHAHKDYGLLQSNIQIAQSQVKSKQTEIAKSIQLLHRTLTEVAASIFLKVQRQDIEIVAQNLSPIISRVEEGSTLLEDIVSSLRPALRTAQNTFNDLFSQGSELNRKLTEAEESLKQAQEDLKRVQAGKPLLSRDVQRLLTELEDHGIAATPVCDLVQITDLEWQPVIEAYLKNNLEALLVSITQEQDAFSIYRGMTGARAVYGAKIVMESRQQIGKQPGACTVASMIIGDHLAAVSYLQRQFGDLRCAVSDQEALTGHRTLTKDGMLVSSGEIDRLRLIDVSRFRIGASNSDHHESVQKELNHWTKEIDRIKNDLQRLTALRNKMQIIANEELILKSITEMWSVMKNADNDVIRNTALMQEATDETYKGLIQLEIEARDHFVSIGKLLEKSLFEKGRIEKEFEQSLEKEAQAKLLYEAVSSIASAAQNHPEIDHDFEVRQWDILSEKYGTDYSQIISHTKNQLSSCEAARDGSIRRGSLELGTFLPKHHEHAPEDISNDWRKAHNWMTSLLRKLHDTELVSFKKEMEAAYLTSQETFRNDVAIALNNNLDWLSDTMNRLNNVLNDSPAFSNGERYRFKRVVLPRFESLLNFVKNVAEHGPNEDLFGGPGELPEEFHLLLEDKTTPGTSGTRSPLDDYREFFEFDIEILREDPLTQVFKVVGRLSKRLGPGSGGEHRAPLYVIAGAALASAYRLDRTHKDGIRLILLDEAFNKMDPTNIIATMRYLEELGLQVMMASPGENLGMLTAFLHRYYDIVRDIDNNTVMIEGRSVSEKTRQLFRSDLPEFNPALVDNEIARMCSTAVSVQSV